MPARPNIINRWRILFPLLLLVNLAEIASAQAYPSYPFRQVVSSDLYKDFVKTLDKERLDVKRQDLLRLPAFATEIDEVYPGTQADKAGLKVGWMLATVDGIPQLDQKMPSMDELAKNPLREYVFYTPEGFKKTFNFGPGKVGFVHFNHSRPERYLLRNAPRGTWDSHLVVAELAWAQGRHDITETALHWASNSGMPPNIFSTHWAAMLSLDRNDFKTSRAMMDAIMATINRQKEIPHYFIHGLRTLSFAHHDWDLLTEVSETDDFLRGTSRVKSLESWKGWKPDSKRDLLAEAEKRMGPDIAHKLIYMPPYKAGRGVKKVEDLRDGRFSKNLKRGLRTAIIAKVPEGLTDVLVRFRATIHFHSPAWSKLPSTFSVGLYDEGGEATASLANLRQEAFHRYVCEYQQAHWSSGKYSLNFCGGPSFYRAHTQRLAPRLVPGVSKEDAEAGLCEITLVRLGDETAIYVDRAQVLHLPVKPEVTTVGLRFFFSSCNFRIRDMVVHSLTERVDR